MISVMAGDLTGSLKIPPRISRCPRLSLMKYGRLGPLGSSDSSAVGTTPTCHDTATEDSICNRWQQSQSLAKCLWCLG